MLGLVIRAFQRRFSNVRTCLDSIFPRRPGAEEIHIFKRITSLGEMKGFWKGVLWGMGFREAVPKKRRCKFCGRRIPEDAKYCPYCGRKLK